MAWRAFVGLLVFLSPLGAAAQSTTPPDQIEAGRALATKLCSSCHVVTGGATGSGSDTAPPFAAVAARRSDAFLHAFLVKPHGKMPPVDLSNAEIDDLVAYIESLKK